MDLIMENPRKRRRSEMEQEFFDNDKIDAINYLDIYSLSQIFMSLSVPERLTMERVCSRWKEASQLSWFNVKKYKCDDSIGRGYNNQLMTKLYIEKLLLLCGNYLRELSLSKNFDSSVMEFVGERCKHLTKLEIVMDDNLNIETNDYIEAFKRLDKLKSIKIQIIPTERNNNRKFEFNAINYLPEMMNEIYVNSKYEPEYLINPSYHELNTPIKFDLKKFKNIKSLTIIACNLDEIIQDISEAITLVHLDLKDSWVTDDCSYIGDDMYNKLVNLEYFINFYSEWKINKHSPSTIFNTCENIKFYQEAMWTDNGAAEKEIKNWKNFEKLEYLTVCWKITDDFAIKMLKHCHNLKYLDMSGFIDDDDMSLSEFEKLTKIKNLECLKLPNMTINDEMIIAITKNCKKLKDLKISYCFTEKYNHDNVFPAIIFDELSKLQYLECLNLSDSIEFQDSSLIAITNNCKNIKNLDISHCRYISEKALDSLTNLKKLEKLNVSGINNFTDNSIVKLKGLKYLSCGSCHNLTDAGIIKLLNNCPDLEQLVVLHSKLTQNIVLLINQVTEKRNNGIILYVNIGFDYLEEDSNILFESKWLSVYENKFYD